MAPYSGNTVVGETSTTTDTHATRSRRISLRPTLPRTFKRGLSNTSEVSLASNAPTVGASSQSGITKQARRSKSERSLRKQNTVTFSPPPTTYNTKPATHTYTRPTFPGQYPAEGNDLDLESESEYSSSELSANTQATSVLSDGATAKGQVEEKLVLGRAYLSRSGPPTRQQIRPVHVPRSGISVQTGRRVAHTRTKPIKPILSDSRQRQKVEKDEFEQLREEAKSLQRKQTAATKQLEDALSRLSSLQADKEEAEKTRNQEKELREYLSHDLDERERRLEDLRNSLEERSRLAEDLRSNLDEKGQLLSDLRSTLDHKSKAVSELESALHEQDGVVCDLRSNFEERGRVLDDLKSTLNDQVERLRTTEKERDTLNKDKDVLDAKLVNLEKDFNHQKGVWKGQEAIFIERIAGLEIFKEGLQLRVEGLEMETTGHLQRIGDMRKDHEQLKDETDKQQSRLAEIEKDKNTLEDEKKELQARADCLDEEKKTLQTRAEDLETRVDELQGEKQELEKRVETLESDSETLKSTIEGLGAEKADQTAQITALATERDKLREENGSLKAQVTDHECEVTQPPEELNTPKDDDETAKEDIKTPEPDNEESESTSGGEDDVIPEKEQEPAIVVVGEAAMDAALLEQLRQQTKELQQRNEELQAEASTISTLTAEKSELEAAQAALQEEVSQVPVLRQHNAAITAQLSTVTQQLEELNISYQASTSEVSSLKTQVGKLRAQLASQSRNSSRARRKESVQVKQEDLVIVRNPKDRDSFQVMRKCDLHTSSASRSSSQPGDDA